MEDIKSYISEAMRIRRTIQIYSEFFNSQESINILTDASIEVASVLKRSMHDEILLSISRLFDSNAYKQGGRSFEYLSQRNLLDKYEDNITPEIDELRGKTTELWRTAELKDFRDLKLSHNNKETMINRSLSPKHKVSFDLAASLVEESINLMIKLQAQVTVCETVSVYKNPNEKYENKGYAFLSKIGT